MVSKFKRKRYEKKKDRTRIIWYADIFLTIVYILVGITTITEPEISKLSYFFMWIAAMLAFLRLLCAARYIMRLEDFIEKTINCLKKLDDELSKHL